ncbi:MAG: DNA repair protein RecN [Actinobacteria bacterium]|nr:MAG: DNA repair protein RecN [Actinomycetota bacterium]
MLLELGVRDLGVIDRVSIVLGPGMTALTGETGAGKTLLVEALELLVGGRADPVLVRPGADEAIVEGRFERAGDEVVLARSIPTAGRSRGWLDARMVPASVLADTGAALVDLHGQHTHQSLLAQAAQRAALDTFGGVDRAPVDEARARLAEIDESLAGLGGDGRARARELDLLAFQLEELDGAGLGDPDEDEALAREENALADATAHREAAATALAALRGDGGGASPAAVEALGTAVDAVAGRAPLAEVETRLRSLEAELADAATELRQAHEHLEDDPARLAVVRDRRQLLAGLRRKYGDTLADVLAFAETARARRAELESHEERVAALEDERERATAALVAAEAALGASRRAAAPRLARSVQTNLRELAMPRAHVEVAVGGTDPGDDVTFMLGANPGEPALPLTKVASGGELSRAMLATRLVLSEAPPTLVFDEVDAGVGGEAALAVGRALAALAGHHQVLVVTHLPQVAAFADHQVAVRKRERGGRTVAEVASLDDSARVVELSRMLSGRPESPTGRDHAEELLTAAARERRR